MLGQFLFASRSDRREEPALHMVIFGLFLLCASAAALVITLSGWGRGSR
jgi:hypothetical protein